MNPPDFEALVSRLLDRDLSPEEFSGLERHLEDSPEARESYFEVIDLHNLLDLELHPQIYRPGESRVISIERLLTRQSRRILSWSAVAAAAVAVLLGVILKLILLPEPAPLLSFRAAPDSDFSVSHQAADGREPARGTLAEGSRLELRQGTVELTLTSGVVSIMQAPADLTLRSGSLLHLDQGSAWFRVPRKAVGFQVQTPELLVTDLGTEFGVRTTPEALDEVHLFAGRVEVSSRHGRPSTELLSGLTARVADPIGRLLPIPPRPRDFPTSLPPGLPFVHLSFDSIEEGVLAVDGTHPDLPAIKATLKPDGGGASPHLVAGRRGQALRLNGQGDMVQTNWPGISGSGPRTLALWVRIPEGTDSDPTEPIAGWGSGSNNGKWKLHAVPNASGPGRMPRISLGTTWFDSAGARLDDGRWHHLAAVAYGRTLDSGLPDLAIFVDGKRQPLIPFTQPGAPPPPREVDTITASPDSVPLTIGASGPNATHSFRGEIDDLYVSNGALSDASISSLAAGIPLPSTQPTH